MIDRAGHWAIAERPAAVAAVSTRLGLPASARWITYVGGFNPHKRIDLILRAHAEVARGLAVPPHLLLVGTLTGDVFHGESGRLRAIVAECGTESLVHWTGFVPDERLRQLHSGALATLLPSECEGFGLPAVEAAEQVRAKVPGARVEGYGNEEATAKAEISAPEARRGRARRRGRTRR